MNISPEKRRLTKLGKSTFSKLQMKQYLEIREAFQNKKIVGISNEDQARLNDVLTVLQITKYIRKVDLNGTNAYEKIGDFKDFEKWHKDKVREERTLSRREWKIAIISAIIGAVGSNIPTIISVIKQLLSMKG